jgi:hypothetical protein
MILVWVKNKPDDKLKRLMVHLEHQAFSLFLRGIIDQKPHHMRRFLQPQTLNKKHPTRLRQPTINPNHKQ